MQEQPPRVVIRPDDDPNTVFPTVGVTMSQVVFWANNDSAAHWPVSPALNIQQAIQPGTTSNTQIPGNWLTSQNITLKQGQVYSLPYTCKLNPGESGILEIVNDFFPINLQPSVGRDSNNNIAPPLQLIQGGKAPYTFQVESSELPDGVGIADGGLDGPVVKGHTEKPGTYLVRIAITDALGNSVEDNYQITIN